MNIQRSLDGVPLLALATDESCKQGCMTASAGDAGGDMSETIVSLWARARPTASLRQASATRPAPAWWPRRSGGGSLGGGTGRLRPAAVPFQHFVFSADARSAALLVGPADPTSAGPVQQAQVPLRPRGSSRVHRLYRSARSIRGLHHQRVRNLVHLSASASTSRFMVTGGRLTNHRFSVVRW